MKTTYKPNGYSTVSPYLIVDGAARTIDFLTKVFDAVSLRQIPGPNGKLMHAEVRIDDTVIMLTDGAEGWPPVPSHVHVYVKNVDETYKRALEVGTASVQEPIKGGDENKRAAVKDEGGTTWWISTKVTEHAL
ncbi:MAG TPA: VOC family protein [Bacteroidota bacterium]